MDANTINEAKQEAERFLRKVKDFEKSRYTYVIGNHALVGVGIKESGALRRSSMDLTRALAKMRTYKNAH
jgi:hypothetical protein